MKNYQKQYKKILTQRGSIEILKTKRFSMFTRETRETENLPQHFLEPNTNYFWSCSSYWKSPWLNLLRNNTYVHNCYIYYDWFEKASRLVVCISSYCMMMTAIWLIFSRIIIYKFKYIYYGSFIFVDLLNNERERDFFFKRRIGGRR